MGEIAREALSLRARPTAWWSVGVVALVTLIVLLYPSVRDVEGLNDYARELPEALRGLLAGGEVDLTGAVGYLNSQLFAVMAPLLLVIFGIGYGAWAVAGDEESGALELVLAQPVSRSRLVLARFWALGVLSVVLGLVIALAAIVTAPIVDLEIGIGPVVAASLSSALLGTLHGAVAMAVGSIRPGKGLAIGVASGVAVGAWLLDGLGRAVEPLEPWRWASPVYQLIGVNPLRDGVPWLGWGLAVALALALAALAAYGLQRRDIR